MVGVLLDHLEAWLGSLHPPHMQERQCCRDCIASSVSPGECFLYSTARQPNKAREVPIIPLHLDPAGRALRQTQTWQLV